MTSRPFGVSGWSATTYSLRGQLHHLLAQHGAADWEVRSDEFWCRVTPPGFRFRAQGWKLHLSATPLAAPIVLDRSAGVLLRAGCPFKFARDLERAEYVASSRYPRGSGGKFLTAYPVDDSQFATLVEELHRATWGLPGPEILSDRRHLPASLVHYRYGAFAARPVLTNDGVFETRLTAPDGSLVEDRRGAWFAPPAWAPAPPCNTADDDAGTPERSPQTPNAVRLAGRFTVESVIQHANKGGVFRARDETTGREVVVKQARPHVGAGLDGSDVRDRLRHEAAMLDLLAGTARVPRKIELFEQQEHVFLATELVSGERLREWSEQRLDPATGIPTDASIALATCRRLVDLLAAVHELGVVLLDFTPNNVLVGTDGELCLVDLEAATAPRRLVRKLVTPGFCAPEQQEMPAWGPAPGPAADRYALGATILFVLTGTPPLLCPDEDQVGTTPGRSLTDRIRDLVEVLATGNPVLRRVSGLVVGLLDERPERRPSLAEAGRLLDTAAATPPTAPGSEHRGTGSADDDSDRLLHDGLAYVLATMGPDDADRLWPSGPFGRTTDPGNVQHGAAGVLSVLVRAHQLLPHEGLEPAVRATAGWLRRRVATAPRALPGLHFGRSGTAWALYDAAISLGDDGLATAAVEMARTVPVVWPNPDVCHGAAGAGLAQLRLWAGTGDDSFLRRAVACADGLLAAAQPMGDGLCWRIPEDFASQLAGMLAYGYAHGVAGIGTFLLAAGTATGDERYTLAAVAAARTLVDAAQLHGEAAIWPAGTVSGRDNPGRADWCGGAAGIGAFLARIGHATGVARYRELARAAAHTVLSVRASASPVACHGLAGHGELLLDLADVEDEPMWRRRAWDLVPYLRARAVLRDGLLVLPDESMRTVTVDYNTGLTGSLAFLLRLRHGGARLWLLDDHVPATTVPATH